jgi:hypothetical protein
MGKRLGGKTFGRLPSFSFSYLILPIPGMYVPVEGRVYPGLDPSSEKSKKISKIFKCILVYILYFPEKILEIFKIY